MDFILNLPTNGRAHARNHEVHKLGGHIEPLATSIFELELANLA